MKDQKTHRLEDKDIISMRKLYRFGYSLNEIAIFIGVHPSTVARYFDKQGYPKRFTMQEVLDIPEKQVFNEQFKEMIISINKCIKDFDLSSL